MKIIRVLKESCIYIIFIVLLGCLKFNSINQQLYEFWQPIIDDFILLILLGFMILNSFKWRWFSKRILYSMIFILILNTYTKLFGMDVDIYFKWYILPLLSIVYTITITTILEICYKLYILWGDGEIKFY